MPEEARLEEQAIASAIKLGLSSQLDEAEQIDVEVKTDLLKVVQGQADSVSVSGQGLVVQKEVRVQALEVQTSVVSLNPLNLLLGQLKLSQPTDAAARITMTVEDINRAMNSEFVFSKLSPLDLDVGGQAVTIALQLPMKIQLPGNHQVEFSGSILLNEPAQARLVGFSATISPRRGKQPLLIESFQCDVGQSISLEFAIALMQKLKEVVDMPYFEMEGVAIQIKAVEVQEGRLMIETQSQVYQVPSV